MCDKNFGLRIYDEFDDEGRFKLLIMLLEGRGHKWCFLLLWCLG